MIVECNHHYLVYPKERTFRCVKCKSTIWKFDFTKDIYADVVDKPKVEKKKGRPKKTDETDDKGSD